ENYWIPEYFKWTPDYFLFEINTLKQIKKIEPGMKALDIGAGIGKCMLSLKHAGFDAYGLEPSQPFYERAISKMGIPAEKLQFGQIENADRSEERRVGKECRSRWSTEHEKKKMKDEQNTQLRILSKTAHRDAYYEHCTTTLR